ncbi:hypothetical protein KKC13_13475 [bacterium]|nr:hypothetical protein [bacterium]MBU1959430.1 hypothetical protein [bacterium]
MYDFKHKINDQQRFNIYETYTQPVEEEEDSLNKIRNTLFFIVLTLAIFMAGVFSLKTYQNHSAQKEILLKHAKQKVLSKETELSHMQLSKAITQSVVKNLQSQRAVQTINDAELKSIIKKVVNKIEEQPNKIKYTQNEGDKNVL